MKTIKLPPECWLSLIENVSDGVYVTDIERKILYWNKSAEKITGYVKEDIIGRKCSDNIL